VPPKTEQELKVYRHALVLAAVSWYLMLAPTPDGFRSRPLLDAPLSKWEIAANFDSVNDCYGAIHDEDEVLDETWKDLPESGLYLAMYKEAGIKCIATDDPRLAK
jgi:hypothetical protein